MTVFVERDGQGNICGVFLLPQPGYAEEEIAANNPEVVEYLEMHTP
jgi:hypothetical protein